MSICVQLKIDIHLYVHALVSQKTISTGFPQKLSPTFLLKQELSFAWKSLSSLGLLSS